MGVPVSGMAGVSVSPLRIALCHSHKFRISHSKIPPAFGGGENRRENSVRQPRRALRHLKALVRLKLRYGRLEHGRQQLPIASASCFSLHPDVLYTAGCSYKSRKSGLADVPLGSRDDETSMHRSTIRLSWLVAFTLAGLIAIYSLSARTTHPWLNCASDRDTRPTYPIRGSAMVPSSMVAF